MMKEGLKNLTRAVYNESKKEERTVVKLSKVFYEQMSGK